MVYCGVLCGGAVYCGVLCGGVVYCGVLCGGAVYCGVLCGGVVYCGVLCGGAVYCGVLCGGTVYHVVCCVGDFKEKTVHSFVMCAHFPDEHTSFDVELWIIGYFLFTRLLIIAHNIPHNNFALSIYYMEYCVVE